MKSLIPILERICIKESAEFYTTVDNALECKNKRFIITANPEIVMMGSKNNKMYQLLLNNKVEIIPDGIGLVKSLRVMYSNREIQRNTGIDLVQHLLEIANRKKKSIFIFGARESVLLDFLKMCGNQYPYIKFSGCYDGYSYTEKDVLKILKECDADIYLAALGTPKQELFLSQFFETKQYGIFVGIGGSLDILSGHIKRAPDFYLNHNLEWLYRILTEPKRIKRFLKSNVLYIFVFFMDYIKWNTVEKQLKNKDKC